MCNSLSTRTLILLRGHVFPKSMKAWRAFEISVSRSSTVHELSVLKLPSPGFSFSAFLLTVGHSLILKKKKITKALILQVSESTSRTSNKVIIQSAGFGAERMN